MANLADGTAREAYHQDVPMSMEQLAHQHAVPSSTGHQGMPQPSAFQPPVPHPQSLHQHSMTSLPVYSHEQRPVQMSHSAPLQQHADQRNSYQTEMSRSHQNGGLPTEMSRSHQNGGIPTEMSKSHQNGGIPTEMSRSHQNGGLPQGQGQTVEPINSKPPHGIHQQAFQNGANRVNVPRPIPLVQSNVGMPLQQNFEQPPQGRGGEDKGYQPSQGRGGEDKGYLTSQIAELNKQHEEAQRRLQTLMQQQQQQQRQPHINQGQIHQQPQVLSSYFSFS